MSTRISSFIANKIQDDMNKWRMHTIRYIGIRDRTPVAEYRNINHCDSLLALTHLQIVVSWKPSWRKTIPFEFRVQRNVQMRALIHNISTIADRQFTLHRSYFIYMETALFLNVVDCRGHFYTGSWTHIATCNMHIRD